MSITISPDLQMFIRPLSPEERARLEANLLAEGCRDALVVWQEEGVLLDGHHRLQLCEQHGLDYRLDEVSLPDLDAAKLWIIRHQYGRRNWTPYELSYNRGKEYEILKRQGKRTDLTFHHSDGKLPSTAHVLAAHYKVGSATIERDAVYAKAIDTLVEVAGPEVRDALLSRDTKVSQQDVKALAKIAPYAAKEVLAAVSAVKTPKQVRKIVREATRQRREHDAYMDAIARSNSPEEDWPASLRPKPTPTPADGLAPRLRQTLHSLEVLHTCLQMVSLPDDLAPHREACLALEKAYWQIAQLMGLQREPPTAADPAAPDCPPFDTTIFVLGKLCKGQHEWGSTGQTRLRIKGRYCPECNSALKRQTRQQQRQAGAVDAPA